jgi:ankyrin repeat protein
MSAAKLPSHPSLEHLKKQAKELLRDYERGESRAVEVFRSSWTPRVAGTAPKLADAQRLIARHYGFASWPKLKAHVLSVVDQASGDPIERIKAAFHNDDAILLREILRLHPQLKAKVNEPVMAFDSPAILWVCSRAMLDVLLEAGADINARSRWWAGSFGLLDSAEPDLAAYAIERGAIVDVHAAARLGLMDRLRALIGAEAGLVHARGGDGQTPLHFARTIEVAEFLLAHGADIDARDIDHESTPAQYMLRDRRDVARYLVSRGCKTDLLMAAALGDLDLARKHLDADPRCIRMSVSEMYFPRQNPRAGGTIYIWTIGSNKTPHLVAREFGHEDVLRLLMERSPEELKLAQACELGDERAFHALLALRPNLVSTLTDEDRRMLPNATQNNNVHAVRLMLAAGWPVDSRGQHRGTALHWAAWHGNAPMVREILKYQPAIEDADNEFRATPLGWATHGSEHGWHRQTGDYPAVVEVLCAAGAKVPKEISGTDAVKEVLKRLTTARK